MKATESTNPKERELDLNALVLQHGSHSKNSQMQMCVMEAVAYVSGEPWSDHPACACPVFTAAFVRLNDRLPTEDRQRLKPFIPLLVGTRAGPVVERDRRAKLFDWLRLEALPKWLELAQLPDLAKRVREVTAGNFYSELAAIRDLARAARDERLEALRVEVRRRVTEALKDMPAEAAAVAEAAEAVAAEAAAVAAAAVAAAAAAEAAVAAEAEAAAAAAAEAAAAAAAAAEAVAAARGVVWDSKMYWSLRSMLLEKCLPIVRGAVAPLREELLTGFLELVKQLIEARS